MNLFERAWNWIRGLPENQTYDEYVRRNPDAKADITLGRFSDLIGPVPSMGSPLPAVMPEYFSPVGYLNEDEIVDHFCGRMDDDDLRSWLRQPEEDLILGHHGTGQNIRNYYKLWHEENPYVVLTDPMHDLFPDQISGRIIRRVWARAKEMAAERGVTIP